MKQTKNLKLIFSVTVSTVTDADGTETQHFTSDCELRALDKGDVRTHEAIALRCLLKAASVELVSALRRDEALQGKQSEPNVVIVGRRR